MDDEKKDLEGKDSGEQKKPENQEGSGKTFTQEQLDYMFSERTKNVKEKTIADLLKELGAENLDAVKSLLQKQKEAEEASKTELQKAQDQAKLASNEVAKMKAESEQALAKANEILLKAEVVRAVASYKDANGNEFRPEAVDDVWLIIDRSLIKQKDDTFEGIKDAIEKVAKERPHWMTSAKNLNYPNGTPRTERKKPNGENKEKTAPTRRFTL